MDLILARLNQLEEQAHQQASSLALLHSQNRQLSSLVEAQDRLLGEIERESFPLDDGYKDQVWKEGDRLGNGACKFKKLTPPTSLPTPPVSQSEPSSAPPSLLLLPTGLLSLMLSFLQPNELPTACLVSFLFLQLASEHLYRETSLWIEQAKLLFRRRDVPGISRLQPFLSLEKIHHLTLEKPSFPRKLEPKGSSSSSSSNPISSLTAINLPSVDDDTDDEDEDEDEREFFLSRYDSTESTPLPLTHLVVKFDYDAEGDLESLSPLLAILNPTTLRLEGPTFEGRVPLILEYPEIDWIYTWYRLKIVEFIGESVIEEEEVDACLERSFAPLEEEGVFRYELRLTFKGTAPDQVRRFGREDLEKRLRIAGAPPPEEEGGLVVESAVLLAKFVASKEEEDD